MKAALEVLRLASSNPPNQVPLMIGEASDGIGHTVVFDIADELSRLSSQSTAQLWVHMVDLAPEDRIEFLWNGRVIRPEEKAFR